MKSVNNLIELIEENFTKEQIEKHYRLSKIMEELLSYKKKKENGGEIRIENTEKILEIINALKKGESYVAK